MPKDAPPTRQSTKESEAATYLHYLTRIFRNLPSQECEEIFTKVFSERDLFGQRKQWVFVQLCFLTLLIILLSICFFIIIFLWHRMFLVDIAASSGASAPIYCLLKRMKSNQITHERIGSIFSIITNNLHAPQVVSDLVVCK